MNKIKYYSVIFTIAIISTLVSCSPQRYQATQAVQFHYEKIETQTTTSNAITTFLEPYKKSSDSLMQIIVGKTVLPLTKSQPECTMGNFVADAQLEYAQKIDPQVVGSVINYGGLRIQYLATGNITMGNIFEIMPFDNTLVIAEVPGSVINTMAQLIIDKKGWPIAGFKIEVDQAGKLKQVLINKQVVNNNIIYKLAISDYLANGGDNCEFFKTCKRKYHKTLVRDIMLDYLSRHQTINPQLTQRIVYE